MTGNKRREWLGGLERSCRTDLGSRITSGSPRPGLDRIEANFNGSFFEPHRHDTYAIGVTLSGIQAFNYRGEKHYSQPGQIIILHPDEMHDGAAGTEDGLLYRMLYLEPSLVRLAMANSNVGLPFVRQPVIEDVEFCNSLCAALGTLDCHLEDIEATGIISEVTDGLNRHSDQQRQQRQSVDCTRVWKARDFLLENCQRNISSHELEQVSGLDRFALARQFRSEFGTSPHRFLIMRRLEHARQLMSSGTSLVETAATVGFADQSHLSRHFKKAFGVTPGTWANAATVR